MAHIEAFEKRDMTRVSREAYRVHENPLAYKNNVDLARSHLNYSQEGIDRNEFLERFRERCNAVMQGRAMQSQTKAMCSWAFTCPEELLGNAKKEEQYFQECYEFVKDRYGKENVIDGVVHYDETTPHMTVYFVPVARSRKTGEMTISKASLITRRELQDFHPALDKHLGQCFGQKGLALNGRTKGGYSLAELKERTKQEDDILSRTKKLKAKESAQDTRESALKARETVLQREEDNFTQKVAEAVRTQSEALERARREYEEKKESYERERESIIKDYRERLQGIETIPRYPETAYGKRYYERVWSGSRFVAGKEVTVQDIVNEANAAIDGKNRIKQQLSAGLERIQGFQGYDGLGL